MKKIINLIVYILFFNIAYSQWVSVGPYGERVNCIYKNGNKLYLCLGSGLYLSTTEGYSWSKISNDTLFGQTYAVTISGNNLIASSYTTGGLKLSTNYGLSWSIIPNSPSYTYKFIKKNNKLFAWYQGAIIKSENDGYNWVNMGFTPGTGGFPYFSYGIPVTFDTLGAYLISSTIDSGIYKSSNDGVNWISIKNGLNNYQIHSLVVGNQNIYVGTNNGGIYKSTNIGGSWVNIGFTGEQITSLLVSENNILAGVGGKGVYYSFNNGVNWIPINNGLGCSGINRLVQSGSNIYAGTSSNGIFISSNNGASWRNANSNIFYTKHIYCLTSQGSNIYAGGDGIFISSNNGLNWVASNIGLGEPQVWGIAFSGIKTYVSTYYGGVFKSTNNCESWTNIGLMSHWIVPLIISGNNLIAGTQGHGIFYTSNEGVNWINTFNDSAAVNTMIKSGSNIYAGTDGDGFLLSSNDGLNWIKISNLSLINSLTISGNNIFAGTGSGVFRSENYGYNWKTLNLGTNYPVIWSIASSGTNIIASGYSDVYVSTNYGENWTLRNQGINPNSWRMYATLIANNFAFVGNDGSGVWRRPLSEVIGINNINTAVSEDFCLFQNYPNPFNPSTTIKFRIKEQGFVTIKIFDILGREVAILLKDEFQPGTYEMPFSFNQFSNSAFSSGIYFYRLEVTDLLEAKIKFIETKKMVLIK